MSGAQMQRTSQIFGGIRRLMEDLLHRTGVLHHQAGVITHLLTGGLHLQGMIPGRIRLQVDRLLQVGDRRLDLEDLLHLAGEGHHLRVGVGHLRMAILEALPQVGLLLQVRLQQKVLRLLKVLRLPKKVAPGGIAGDEVKPGRVKMVKKQAAGEDGDERSDFSAPELLQPVPMSAF